MVNKVEVIPVLVRALDSVKKIDSDSFAGDSKDSEEGVGKLIKIKTAKNL